MGSIGVAPGRQNTVSVVVHGLSCPVACGSAQIRDQTPVSGTGRQILYHWATKEALPILSLAFDGNTASSARFEQGGRPRCRCRHAPGAVVFNLGVAFWGVCGGWFSFLDLQLSSGHFPEVVHSSKCLWLGIRPVLFSCSPLHNCPFHPSIIWRWMSLV